MGIDPATLTGLSVLSSFASTAVGFSTQMRAAEDAKAWSDYNAKVLENEAVVARQQAGLEMENRRKEGKRFASTQRVMLSKSGVELSSGSPLSLLEETATENELAIQTIKWAGDQQARRAMSAAQAGRIKGDAKQRAGYWGAGTTLLTGAMRTGGMAAKAYGVGTVNPFNKPSSIIEENLYE